MAIDPTQNPPFFKPVVPTPTVAASSPEAGPIVPTNKETPGVTEYGYDTIKRIEAPLEQGSFEKKEARPITATPPVTQPAIPPKLPPMGMPPLPATQAPKFFGYMIPPQIANNFSLIVS